MVFDKLKRFFQPTEVARNTLPGGGTHIIRRTNLGEVQERFLGANGLPLDNNSFNPLKPGKGWNHTFGAIRGDEYWKEYSRRIAANPKAGVGINGREIGVDISGTPTPHFGEKKPGTENNGSFGKLFFGRQVSADLSATTSQRTSRVDISGTPTPHFGEKKPGTERKRFPGLQSAIAAFFVG